MFLLKATNQSGATFWWTGCAGQAWVSPRRLEAYPVTREYADRKLEQFNRLTLLHGLTFTTVGG